MDYEKKYKEALSKCKAYIDDTEKRWSEEFSRATEEVFKEIFPELRESESEDERIRKVLIHIVKGACSKYGIKYRGDEISEEKLLSYLEKQKEPEKEELVYRLNGLMQEYINEGEDDNEKEHRMKCYCLFWDALEDTSYFEQKEQKQTDLPAGFYYIDLNGNRYYSKEFRYGDMKLKVGELKPAEWSEGDEKQLDDIISIIREAYEHGITISETRHRKAYSWLNNLRPSLKPSEEDERILKGIIGKIDHDQTYGVSKDEMLNFLKRL